MTEKEIRNLLKHARISITENRIKMIDCLINDETHFHSVNQFQEHIQNMNTKSIYNNLKTLVNAGLIDVYSFNGTQKYALKDGLIKDNDHNYKSAHVISKSDVVKHVKINDEIYNNIKQHAEKQGINVKNIKIFIEEKS